MASELRKAIEEPLEALGRYVIESITLLPTNVELRKLNKNQAVDAVLDAVLAALPEDIGSFIMRDGQNRYDITSGFSMGIERVKSILEEAKKQ